MFPDHAGLVNLLLSTHKSFLFSPLGWVPIRLGTLIPIPLLALKFLALFRLVFCFCLGPFLLDQPFGSLTLAPATRTTHHTHSECHLLPLPLTFCSCEPDPLRLLLAQPYHWDGIISKKQLGLIEPSFFQVKYPQILQSSLLAHDLMHPLHPEPLFQKCSSMSPTLPGCHVKD